MDPLFGAGVGFLGGIVNNLFSGSRQEDSQEFNAQQALQAMQFNRQEAATARGFNAEQAGMARGWASGEADLARIYNSGQAREQRDWTEAMSSSAYQRTMNDMKSAGLNPILAYRQGGSAVGGGATASTSAPSGASASGGAASGAGASTGAAPVFDMVGPALSTAVQMQRVANETEVANAQVQKLKAETRTEDLRPGKVSAETETERRRPSYVEAHTAESGVRYEREKAVMPENRARGVKGQIEEDVWSSGAGKILYGAGLVGGSTAKTIAPVLDAVSQIRRRWP